MSVLSQALSSASHSHKLEFTVRSTEELDTVMEELKACDSEVTLQHSLSRFCSAQINKHAANAEAVFEFV